MHGFQERVHVRLARGVAQAEKKSAGSLATQTWSDFQRARQAGGGRYLERIKADRHAAKLGAFVLELIRKMTAFATLLICPCARQSSRKSAGSLVHRSGLIFSGARGKRAEGGISSASRPIGTRQSSGVSYSS